MSKTSIKKLLIYLIPGFLKNFILHQERELSSGLKQFQNNSYSQEGEDLILNRIFKGVGNGFYVDVGAHHPRRFSNTFIFYKNGWRGINIDAMPGSMEAFQKERPEDINLELGVSEVEDTLNYYIFNEPALNGFKNDLSSLEIENQTYFVKEKRLIKTYPLKRILEEHLPPGQPIDFLSIGVEGFDLNVLKSNDWQKYRPAYVLVEDMNAGMLSDVFKSETYKFLSDNGYEAYAKCFYTVIYKKVID